MRIAIVDDLDEDRQILKEYLGRYNEEKSLGLEIRVFSSSIEFLENYRNDYDILFLDIEMPGTDGLSAAREIRERDDAAVIVFVTNMAQYAICGYEVDAVDFMVKPVEYVNVTVKLEKAMNRVRRKEKERVMLIEAKDGIHRILASHIIYVEKDINHLVYHTIGGVFRERGSMTKLKAGLYGYPFGECTAGCLVNFKYVDLIGKDSIQAGDQTLILSRRMKKKFVEEYMEYIGGDL